MKWNSVFLPPMAHVMFADKSLGTANSFQAQWVWAALDVPLGGRWPVCWPVGCRGCHATLSLNHRRWWVGVTARKWGGLALLQDLPQRFCHLLKAVTRAGIFCEGLEYITFLWFQPSGCCLQCSVLLYCEGGADNNQLTVLCSKKIPSTNLPTWIMRRCH